MMAVKQVYCRESIISLDEVVERLLMDNLRCYFGLNQDIQAL